MKIHDLLSRRQILMAGSLGAAAWLVPGVFADELCRTPAMTEGPFYPDRLPLDTDNDLVIVGNSTTPAVGEITHSDGPGALAQRHAAQQHCRGDLAGRCQRRLPAHADRQRRPPRSQFPGLRAVHDQSARRIPLPHGQAGGVSGPLPHIHFKIKRGDRDC